MQIHWADANLPVAALVNDAPVYSLPVEMAEEFDALALDILDAAYFDDDLDFEIDDDYTGGYGYDDWYDASSEF
jgi:hypothetical protein